MALKSRPFTNQIINGAGWTYSNIIVCRIISLLKMLILARILTPDDFGIFGIVTIMICMAKEFSTTGMDMSLIQQKEDVERYLDAAWTTEAIRGLIISALLFVIATPVSRFFGEKRVIPLLQVMSVSFVLVGFKNIGIIYFIKELKFYKQFIYDVSSMMISFVAAVFFAYKFQSAWALVLAELTLVITRFILSYSIHPYRPCLRFDFSKMKELIHYGKWVFASTIAIFIGSQLDNLMVGKMLGVTALGLYAMAYNLSLVPVESTTYAISQVAFPSYAKLQNDRRRLKDGFNRIFQLTTFLSIPACTGLAIIAPLFVKIVLGDKWHDAILPLQILMIAQLMKSIVSTGSPLFMGTGKPNYEFYMQLTRTSIMLICIYPLIYWLNISGAAWVVVLSALGMVALFIIYIDKACGFNIKDIARMLLPVFLSTILMVFLVMKLSGCINIEHRGGIICGLPLAALIFAGVLIYLWSMYFIARKTSYVTVFKDIKTIFAIVYDKLSMFYGPLKNK